MFKRIVPSIRKRVAQRFWPNGRGIVRRDGVLYLLNLKSDNWYDKWILQWGSVEPLQRKYLLSHIEQRKCEIFIDVGANFGTYTLFIAANTKCDVIAFEPDKRSFEKLRANLLINGLTERVETRMVAVSDRNGTVPFKRGPANDDSSSEIGTGGSDGFTVPCVSLDEDLSFKGRRIAFKFDIQSHELTALQGMKRLLHENDCFLQIECIDINAGPFIKAMETEGFKLLHRIDIDYYFSK